MENKTKYPVGFESGHLDFTLKVLHVVIYVRLSREDIRKGESESTSIVNQIKMLTNYAEERGWIVDKIYKDDGFTGTNFNRPRFQELLDDIEARKIKCVLTKDLSRLGRNYSRVGYYIEEYFPEHNVRYIAVGDNVDTINNENDIAPFKNVLNEMYAKDISRKVKESRQVGAKKGLFMGSRPAYGYKRHPEDKHRLIFDEVVYHIVHRMFLSFDSGITARAIATNLTNDGIPNPTAYYYISNNKNVPKKLDISWSATVVMTMLKNPVYNGTIINGMRKTASFKSKKRINVPPEDWQVFPNMHPKIADDSLWDSVQKKIVRLGKERRRNTQTGDVSLFSGVVYCGDCGAPLAHTTKHYKSGDQRLYRCSRYNQYGAAVCNSHNIKIEELVYAVSSDIETQANKLLNNNDYYVNKLVDIAFSAKNSELKETEKLLKQAQNRKKIIDGLIRQIYEDKYLGKISEQMYEPMMSNYQGELEEISETIKKSKKLLTQQSIRERDVHQWTEAIKQETKIKTLDRKTVLSLIDRIEVFQAEKKDTNRSQRISIHYKFVGHIA